MPNTEVLLAAMWTHLIGILGMTQINQINKQPRSLTWLFTPEKSHDGSIAMVYLPTNLP